MKIEETVIIVVDEEKTKQLKYERGKDDAIKGYAPMDPSPEYRDGYAQGRRQHESVSKPSGLAES